MSVQEEVNTSYCTPGDVQIRSGRLMGENTTLEVCKGKNGHTHSRTVTHTQSSTFTHMCALTHYTQTHSHTHACTQKLTHSWRVTHTVKHIHTNHAHTYS
jgi:hypothetical protein